MMRPADIRRGLERIAAAMPAIERDLNAADSRLGDGDTGGMLARLVDGLRTVDVGGDAEDIGAYLMALSRAANEATGSSLGNLIATALSAMGRRMKGEAALHPEQVGTLLAAARDAMLARGGADLGDKTVIDSIHTISEALAGCRSWEDVGPGALSAANDALAAFRGRPIRIGRARMFGDATRDLDDPGMLAVAMLLDAAIPSEFRQSGES